MASAATLGTEIPGSASTVGFKLRSKPRVSLSARAGLARFSTPDILQGYTLPVDDRKILVPTVQISGVAGVFNGFSPLPTVGGVLSVDVTGSAQRLFAPRGDGFQGGLWGWGIGTRIGLLRESFTLPGVSLSLARRWMGSARWGRTGPSTPARLALKDGITSLRAAVGKDLFGVGFVGGAGWDWISGRGTLALRPAPGEAEILVKGQDLESTRFSCFLGASRTFLILQLSGEAGWSQSVDAPLPVDPGGDDYPSARAFYGAVALRITF
jgi:hypothetical protein